MRAEAAVPAEWEPKTLSLEELKYAREAALFVLSTHSSEDAVRIFTEGLKPVNARHQEELHASTQDDEEDGHMFEQETFMDDRDICRCTSKKRDVATAPF